MSNLSEPATANFNWSNKSLACLLIKNSVDPIRVGPVFVLRGVRTGAYRIFKDKSVLIVDDKGPAITFRSLEDAMVVVMAILSQMGSDDGD